MTTVASKRIYLETLGCSKNRVDSEVMLAQLTQSGHELVESEQNAEVIVVNTCGFLTAASEESVNRILELSKQKSSGSCEKLVATGCLTQRYREELSQEIPELDGLLGSHGFERMPELISAMYEHPEHPQIFLSKKPHYTHYEQQERIQSTPRHFAYVKIAEGCSNMCTFCNIPYLRGGFSSRTVETVTEEIRGLVAKGVREINLISQDTSSYGRDFRDGSTDLTALLRSISGLDGDFWVRMFYCYPNTFTEATLEIMAADARFCRYLDMPFQHVSDAVLKRMNRKITRRQIEERMQLIRSYLPEVAWRTTFIVGFPTETEADFEELLEFVQEGHFQHVGVFTYSHEDNIRSAKWGDPVPDAVKHKRRKQLMAAQQAISLQHNQNRVGQSMRVLVDGYSEETDLLLQGRTEFQGPDVDGVAYINEGTARPGSFHEIEITDAHAYDLVGRIVEPN